MRDHELLRVRVWGDYACFTRPEMKAERVSYPVMTPSAARGILESIFWKPEFAWRVRSISVLKPIRNFSLVRNETTEKVAPSTVARWMEAEAHDPFLIDESRAQRSTLGLRDVAYRIEAGMRLRDDAGAGEAVKYREQFLRRVNKGQCHTRPVLGCREFAAHFGPDDAQESALALTQELGLMLFDVCYSPDTGRGTPVFFSAELSEGVLTVSPALYEEVGR